MLFKKHILEGIATGKVRLAFRKWRRPTVTTGGTLLTPVGQLKIREVTQITEEQIRERDASLAGFASLAELQAELTRQRSGQLYRICFRLIGPDPRIALRQATQLQPETMEQLSVELARLDQRAKHGPWTLAVLQLIGSAPEQSAGSLAQRSGYEKEWLKLNIRKLKNLGLTESLNPGYRLSPRGVAYLARLRKG